MSKHTTKLVPSLPYMVASLIALLSLAVPLAGQANGGTPKWSAYDSGQYDTISLQNLSVSLNVPVMSKAGAFPFRAVLTGGDSYFSFNGSSLQPGILGVPLTPSINGVLSPFGYAIVLPATTSGVTCPSTYGSGTATEYTNWYLQFPDGTTHYLSVGVKDVVYGGPSCSSTLTDTVLDGSGWTVTINGHLFYTSDQGGITQIVSSSGMVILPGSSVQDTQSTPNMISYNNSEQTYTDTLGTDVLTVNANAAGQLGWFDVSGGTPTESQTLSDSTLKTSFSCSGKPDYPATGGTFLTTAIGFPDGSNIGLAWEPNQVTTSDYTGRLKEITLRGGGTITYNWNAAGVATAPYGFNCTYLVPNEVTRTTSDGTTTYTWAAVNNGSGNWGNTTTKVDQGGNTTVYTFTGLTATGSAPAPVFQALTQVQHYQDSSTLLTTDLYCYNAASGQPGNCLTAVVQLPVTEVDVYHTISGMSTSSRTQTLYDNYGNVTQSSKYDFGSSSPTFTTANGYSATVPCGPASTIKNRLCSSVTTDGSGNIVASSKFTYSSQGNLLTSSFSPNGSSFLSNPTPNSYNGNGTPSVTYDLAGNATTYAYSGSSYTGCVTPCTNFPFPTSISSGGLTASATYYGAGGVKHTQTDPNGSTTTYGYTDPWNRVTSIQDPLGNTIYKTYSATSLSSSFAFGSSVNDTTTTLDGYGRTINVQTQQGPGATTYDTISTAYGWGGASNDKRLIVTNVPCVASLNATCGGTTDIFVDVLGRNTWTSTPATTEYVQIQYNQNDVWSTLGPAPTGENLKEVQKQYDGLGRLTSTCKFSSTVSGYVACGQNTNTSTTGIVTTKTYPTGIGSQTVSSTRGTQTRSRTFDGLGRLISSTTPEGGTVTKYYDTVPSACSGGAVPYPGKLIETLLQNGNFSCYEYDSLGRVTAITGVIPSSTTLCRRFYYDNSNGATGTIPSGITISNPYGRLVEAETDACTTWPLTTASIITDEWFSYDKDGHMTDMWELTPHSTQYYHSTATFAGNGMVTALQLVSPSLYTMNYTLDGEGRWNTLAQNSTSIVTGPAYPTPMYNAASQATEVDLTDGDKDLYTYSPYTGRMTQYEFEVGGANETGVLTWNANNTLQSLVITDGFNAGGSQTCASSYDDLARLAVFDCGSGNWGQDFGYDQYDNLSQTVISGRSGSTWNPGYSSSNNHVTGATYDASGDMTSDGGMNVYGWNWFNKLAWTAGSGTPSCGTNGKCITYDAFGRMVEKSTGAAWSEIWYTQVPGSQINMSGITANYGYWPSPGRGTFIASGTNMFLHQDWLGNDRIVSATALHTVSADRAYAPYGEQYNTFGSTNPIYGMFAGITGDFDSGVLFDTPNRELAQYQGRWLSPDPAGARWNQYAYPTNPNSRIDRSGLLDEQSVGDDDDDDDDDDGGSGGGCGCAPPGLPDPTNLPPSAFGPPPESVNPPPDFYSPGDPAGVQIGQFLFEYQGPNTAFASSIYPYDLTPLLSTVPVGANVDVNVWQEQLVDVAGIPVQGNFDIDESVVQSQVPYTSLNMQGTVESGSWTSNGSFVDNIGVTTGDPNFSGWSRATQMFSVNGVPLSTVNVQYIMYGQGTLGMGFPQNVVP
jgi:RHS repeat-associated protein